MRRAAVKSHRGVLLPYRGEKIRLCRIVTDSGAGISRPLPALAPAVPPGGRGPFAEHIGPHVKIKAAGGIANLRDAESHPLRSLASGDQPGGQSYKGTGKKRIQVVE